MTPTPTRRNAAWIRLAAIVAQSAAILALSVGCAGGTVGNSGDGQCLRPSGCLESGCCSEERVCATMVCEGVGYVCGLDSTGSWNWLTDTQTTSCDDSDPCTEKDSCASGRCLGVRMACATPPSARCIDSSTLRSFASPGSCAVGTCSYSEKDTVCPQGCAAGQCTGQPCLGVQCTTPPSACHKSPGTCTNGTCSYPALPAGSACGTGDPCTSGGTCDAQGSCSGKPLTCAAANASGACVNGACNYTCTSGYGDCSGGWADGCETKLDTTSNCGACGKACSAAHASAACVAGACSYSCTSGYGDCSGGTADGCETRLDTASNCGACGKVCSAGANATASCSGGACTLSCKAPYKDCDGKSSNGCEIPVGVANKCDKSGLNSSRGCGTAHCGSSSTSGAANFGSWTCTFCSHCHLFSGGYSWCLYSSSSTGQFSSDTCSTCCNASLADKVCSK